MEIRSWFRANWSYLLALISLVLICYGFFLNNAFISDDVAAIQNSPTLGSLKYVTDSLQAFTGAILYVIAYKIAGLTPFFYRLPNVLFHLGSVIMLFLILSRTTNRLLAFYTSAIFAIHPLLTESIVWISGGSYVRYGFFLLVAFWLYLLGEKNRRYTFLSYFFFFLSLFSSGFAIIFPFILLLYEFSRSHLRKHIRTSIPYFIMSAIYFFIILIPILHDRLTNLPKLGDFANTPAAYHYNLALQIPITVTKYLQLLFIPYHLTLYHAEILSYFEVAVRTVFLLLFIGVIAYFYKKNKQIFFWLTFFLICISPALLPIGATSTVGERYVYLGSIGIIFPIAYLIYRIGQHKQYVYFSYVLFGLIIIALTVRTIVRNNDWRSFNSFWTAEARTSPMSFQARNNMGNIDILNGDYQDGIDEYIHALQIVPGDAKVNQNLAYAYLQTGDNEDALKYYQIALKNDPKLWQVDQNIAGVYYLEGKFDLAKQFTEKALTVSGPNVNLYVNLGLIEAKLGNNEAANQALEKARLLDPQNPKIQQAINQLK